MRFQGVGLLCIALLCTWRAGAQCDFEPEVVELARDTLFVDSTPDTRCLIGPQGENCIGGTGNRSLLRFTTLIHNVGIDDCIVGPTPFCPNPGVVPPDAGPWHFATCHEHWHLQGYADYYVTGINPGFTSGELSDPCGTLPDCPKGGACRLVEGHKTGFCLMDSYCGDDPADAFKLKYICRYQGITGGCSDAYVADLPCQWVDITGMESLFDQDLCLCVAVNSNDNIASRGLNIAREVNRRNNRACVPFKFKSLPQFIPRNNSYLAEAGYLDAKNRCLGWSNSTLDASLRAVPREAGLAGGRPSAAGGRRMRQPEGRPRLTAADVKRIQADRERQQGVRQAYAARAAAAAAAALKREHRDG